MRTIVGVIVGYLVWTALWLGGGAAIGAAYPKEFQAFQDGQALTLAAPLGLALALSVLCSLIAGALTRRMTRGWTASLLLALLLLVTGIVVQVDAWERMPETYHFSFLILLVPMTLLGARLTRSRPGTDTWRPPKR